jgi:hypothetical protein
MNRKLNATVCLVAIAGATIALRQATVTNGAVLGLHPAVAVVLVAGAAWAVPQMVRA